MYTTHYISQHVKLLGLINSLQWRSPESYCWSIVWQLRVVF